MQRTRLSFWSAWSAVAVGATAWFALSTALLAHIPKPLPLALGLLLAAAYAALSGRRFWPADDKAAGAMASIGGVLVFWAAPMLVASQRLSDTPSGADTLLLSAVASGLFVVIASYVSADKRRSVVAWALAVVAAVGATGLLANWERPSSFSPFAKFPERELIMLAAAMVFAVGVMLAVRAVSRCPQARGAVVMGPALVGVLVAIPDVGVGIEYLPIVGPTLFLAGVAYAVFASGLASAIAIKEPVAAGSALLIVPVLFTGLSVVERMTAVAGPDPIVWPGALAGMALCVVGVAGLLVTALLGQAVERRPLRDVIAANGRDRGVLVVAASAALLALLSLAFPATLQTTRGVTTGGEVFRAAWTEPGLRTAAGLAAAAAGLAVFSGALGRLAREHPAVWASALLGALVAIITTPVLGISTLRTWVDFVPTEIQQSYGTEYARLTVESILHPVRVASLVLSAVAGLAVVLFGRGRELRRTDEELD